MTESTSEPATALVTREGSLLWLTLNRPERLNAVSRPMYEAISAAVRTVEDDVSLRAVVLTGAGRAFCSGADLKAHAESRPSPGERQAYVRAAQRANLALQRCTRPVVAAVHGAAVGAGLELALSCDLIIVASDAKLRLPELALGTFFGGGVAHTLPARVGLARARELLFLGDFFSGADAAAMGLANRAVPREAVIDAARALARLLSERAPIPLRLTKQLLHDAPRMSRAAVLRAEAAALMECMATNDWAEGIQAHREKRTPRYSGE